MADALYEYNAEYSYTGAIVLSGNGNMAVTFVAESNHSISSIKLRMQRANVAWATVSLRLTDVNHLPTGSNLITSKTLSGEIPESLGDVLFTFPNTYSVIANTEYAIVVNYSLFYDYPTSVLWLQGPYTVRQTTVYDYGSDGGVVWTLQPVANFTMFYEVYGPTSSYTFVQDSFEVESVLGQTISTLRGTIHDPLAIMTIPSDTDIMQVDISNGEILFAGITSYVTDYTTGIERYFDLICQDYSILLDRSLVYAAYPAGFTYTDPITSLNYSGDVAILMDLFRNRVLQPLGAAHGPLGASEIIIDPTFVQQGVGGLTALNFFYMTLRECVELLANYVLFDYYVDYQKNLRYFFIPNNDAPYSLSSNPNGTTSVGYHGLRRKIDGTRVVNNFIVLGTQLAGTDQTMIMPNDGSTWRFNLNFIKQTSGFNAAIVPLGAPSSSTTGLIQVFINTNNDVTPVWVEDTIGGVFEVDENPTPGSPPTSYDWLYDPTTNNIYFQSPPPNLVNSWKIVYALILNGGIPDSVPDSIAQYGRTFSDRLVAGDSNSAATIMTNLAHLKSQFAYALQIITLSIDSIDFPGTTRFERGQYVHLTHEILGIMEYYWIHSITSKVQGGTVVSYDLELRNYSISGPPTLKKTKRLADKNEHVKKL